MTQSLLQTLSQAFPGTNAQKLTRVIEMMLFEQLFYLCMEKKALWEFSQKNPGEEDAFQDCFPRAALWLVGIYWDISQWRNKRNYQICIQFKIELHLIWKQNCIVQFLWTYPLSVWKHRNKVWLTVDETVSDWNLNIIGHVFCCHHRALSISHLIYILDKTSLVFIFKNSKQKK